MPQRPHDGLLVISLAENDAVETDQDKDMQQKPRSHDCGLHRVCNPSGRSKGRCLVES